MRDSELNESAESGEPARHVIVDVDSSSPLLQFPTEPASPPESHEVDIARGPITESRVGRPSALLEATRTNRASRAVIALLAFMGGSFVFGTNLYEVISDRVVEGALWNTASPSSAQPVRQQQEADRLARSHGEGPPDNPVDSGRLAEVVHQVPQRDVSGTWMLDSLVKSSALKGTKVCNLGIA